MQRLRCSTRERTSVRLKAVPLPWVVIRSAEKRLPGIIREVRMRLLKAAQAFQSGTAQDKNSLNRLCRLQTVSRSPFDSLLRSVAQGRLFTVRRRLLKAVQAFQPGIAQDKNSLNRLCRLRTVSRSPFDSLLRSVAQGRLSTPQGHSQANDPAALRMTEWRRRAVQR
jgi:hypothetical protein